MTRIYATLPIEVTRIGEHLNTIAKTIARNPKIEEVTGHDFIVYLTYSYDVKDRLGWIASSNYGTYMGTQKDADNEWSPFDYYASGQAHLKPLGFMGAVWFETEKEAVEAQERYEASVIEASTQIVSEPVDANLNGTIDQFDTGLSWKDRLKNLFGFNL